jgi:undecaprenyl pyrophosphate phosphatase UppP
MEDNDTIVFENSEISWSRPLRFWLLFISVIPSITCSLFVLYHLLFDQTLRHALNNHTIIVLLLLALVFQLIDVTWYLDFIRRGIVWPQTPARCLVWWLVDLVYTLPVCGATPCHILHPIIGLWEMGVHGCLCTMIIAFSSIALLIRVIIQKHRHNQIFQWKKYRKNDISTGIHIGTLFII